MLIINTDGSVVVSPSVGVTGELLTVPCPRRGDALQGTLAGININHILRASSLMPAVHLLGNVQMVKQCIFSCNFIGLN